VRIGVAAIVFGAALPGAAEAAQPACETFSFMKRLPESFRMIASADLGGVEAFTVSNRRCTCDNGPGQNRKWGRPAPEGIYWSCRKASAEERRSN
jgi:hypothetical protein